MSAVLYVDVGNTRLKWQMAFQGRVVAQGVCLSTVPVIDLAPQLAALVRQVVVSSVAGPRSDQGLAAALENMRAGVPEFVTSRREWGALVSGYADPTKLGVDRWLAMIAATADYKLPLIVVDAGTALTVDGIASSGRHLGGYIAPGLRTMLRSLGEATAAIPIETLAEALPGARTTSTREAVCQGVVEASRGLVDRAIKYLRAGETLTPTVVVTGGDRRMLNYQGSGWQLCPDLVLRGLRYVSGEKRRFAPP